LDLRFPITFGEGALVQVVTATLLLKIGGDHTLYSLLQTGDLAVRRSSGLQGYTYKPCEKRCLWRCAGLFGQCGLRPCGTANRMRPG